MDEDDDQYEAAAEVECAMVDAAKQLKEEFDYSLEDLLGIIKGTCA